MRTRLALLLALVVAVPVILVAQATRIFSSGTLPATCTVGNIYIKTGASTGFYACLATDTWTGPFGDVTASSTATFTNKTIDAEGAGNVITLPQVFVPLVAGCQNTSASLGFSTPTSDPAVPACVTGTNTQYGVAQFADGADLSMQARIPLPADWTGAIDATGKWRTSATTGDVVWQIQTVCVADGETGDPAFNAASTTTDAAKGTTLQFNDFAIAGVTTTGCAASEEMFFKVRRDAGHGSDTLAATAELISLTLTVRRAM